MMIVKEIKPMFSRVVTTMERYGVDEVKGVLIDPTKVQGEVKDIQTVIAVGTTVTDIKVGDKVKVNPFKYVVYEDPRDNPDSNSMMHDIPHHKKIKGFNIPQVEIDGQMYLMLSSQDIEYVITKWEEEKEDTGLLHTEPKLII